jgi:hypothetical protein
MGMGFFVGVLPHYTEHSAHQLRVRDEVAAILARLGERPYHDDPLAQKDAHASIRANDHTGGRMFDQATEPFQREAHRSPLVGDADILLPRALPGLLQGEVARYASLEFAWMEWLHLGRLLRIPGAEAGTISDDVALKLDTEVALDDDGDGELVDARQAWIVFFEGLRVARERGHALTIM